MKRKHITYHGRHWKGVQQEGIWNEDKAELMKEGGLPEEDAENRD
jgi:hypothetical protein